MKGISNSSMKLDQEITLKDALEIKEFTKDLKGNERLKVSIAAGKYKLDNDTFEDNATAIFSRTSKNNLQKAIHQFEKIKHNILENKSLFHKPELAENIFNYSTISVKKLNFIVDQKIADIKQQAIDSTPRRISEALEKRPPTESITDGIAIAKNIRSHLNNHVGNANAEVKRNAIESTVEKFKTITVKILKNNNYNIMEEKNAEDKALLLKYFETIPGNIQTKLINLHPALLENKTSSPESEINFKNETGIKLTNEPNKEKLNDRIKLKELHTNYLKNLSISDVNTKDNGSIENQAINFSNKIIEFLYDDKNIDEPSIQKLIDYRSEMPEELKQKISEKFTSLVKNNDGIPIDTQLMMLSFF